MHELSKFTAQAQSHIGQSPVLPLHFSDDDQEFSVAVAALTNVVSSTTSCPSSSTSAATYGLPPLDTCQHYRIYGCLGCQLLWAQRDKRQGPEAGKEQAEVWQEDPLRRREVEALGEVGTAEIRDPKRDGPSVAGYVRNRRGSCPGLRQGSYQIQGATGEAELPVRGLRIAHAHAHAHAPCLALPVYGDHFQKAPYHTLARLPQLYIYIRPST
ncbi:hypothetical protein SAY87_024734 [Trapa incisa]|uniref:Uncharacterized protein n=1 Tax=Trapa incisa TaxID=236973 RepID=A0AAN7GA27_9MYRT|nr:hypothetical protein SAY87_024734 [Trapa incisa]